MPKENDEHRKGRIERRTLLKAMAGAPVLGALGFETLRKLKHDAKNNPREQIIHELGLDDLLSNVKPVTTTNGDLIRVGIVGFGVRGTRLAKELGFMEKSRFERELAEQQEAGGGPLKTKLESGNFNVAITGICDVFDLHAERGLTAARHDIFTGGDIAKANAVKRYGHYHDMLADPSIDAIIIATPDHHHAQMTIDAINAGKHVYCEKAPVHREDEILPLYDTVRNSELVYQMGHQNPQNAVFQQARQILDRGLLGNISHIATTTNRNSRSGAWIRHKTRSGEVKPGDASSIDWQQWLGKAPQVPFSIERFYSWARFFEYDTGLFGQLFSHEFDAVNQLLNLGIPNAVSSTGGQYFYKELGDMPDVLHTSFEYADKGTTLTYSANLTSSKSRPRTIYGRDASMTIGADLTMTPDAGSERYAGLLDKGLADSSRPMLEILEGADISSPIDAVTSASVKYYAARGLTRTFIDGKEWDVTQLHLKEWLDCIRFGGEPSANIEKALEEAVVIAMADISYREQRRTSWDPVNKQIVRI
jgi:predicted dehydrogenase